MRAVVTGAAGFIGGRITAALRAAGHGVTGLDLRGGHGVTAADLSRPGPWEATLDGADLVVHAAARVSDAGRRDEFWRATVQTTAAVLSAAARHGVGRVLHLSSIVVHGRHFPDGVAEEAPLRPTGSPYTDTKIVSEHLALLHHAAGRVPVTVLRPGDVYGPGSPQWTLRPVRLLRRGLFALPRGPLGVLSPVHVDDLVEAALAAAAHPAAAGRVFHVTGGAGVPVTEFFGHYARALGVPLRRLPPGAQTLVAAAAPAIRRLGGEPLLTRHTAEYVRHPGTYSIAAIGETVGWRPRTPLAEGMAGTLAWLRAEGLLGPDRPKPDGRGSRGG
jgi:nucleoside-diphosphate-sugar epimerase